MAKRILVLALILSFVVIGLAYADSKSLSLTGEIRGQAKQASEPHRTFRLVRFAPKGTAPSSYSEGKAAANITIDSIVVWDITCDDGVTINLTNILGDSAVAGIVVSDVISLDSTGAATATTAVEDAGKANWTWLQTYGYCTVNAESSVAIQAGDAMGTANQRPGYAETFTPSTSEPDRQGNAGFFLDNSGTLGAEVEAFIRTE